MFAVRVRTSTQPMGKKLVPRSFCSGRLVCFGGGANISNDIAWLDCTPTGSTDLQSVAEGGDEDEAGNCGLDLVWGKPKSVEGSQPRPRLSHAAVRAGRHIIVYGGWGRTFAHANANV